MHPPDVLEVLEATPEALHLPRAAPGRSAGR